MGHTAKRLSARDTFMHVHILQISKNSILIFFDVAHEP